MKSMFSITETVNISYEIRYNEETIDDIEKLIVEVYKGNPWIALEECEDIYEILHNQIEDYFEVDFESFVVW